MIVSSSQTTTDGGQLQRLKSALWHALGTNIDSLGLAQDINATPQFIGALTELVWNQIRK